MGNTKTIKGKEKQLASNTFFLYIMTFSTQLLNVITVPYLTRVLGPTTYGRIGLAVAYMTYVQLILDFGFLLSATQKVAQNKTDTEFLSKLVSAVTAIKLVLSAVVAIVFLAFFSFEFIEKKDILFYFIYLLAYAINALIPDYYYRGIENMKKITVRTVFIKTVFAVLIFVFVKQESDFFFVPVSLLIGNGLALLISVFDLKKNYNLCFSKPEIASIIRLFDDSVPFFVSRISATFYQALNVVILGQVYSNNPVVGYYTSSDKLISLVKSGSSPIADSLYPYMVQNRNFKLVKKMLTIIMPLITLGVIVVGIFAEQICILLFGAEYASAGNILRLLLPIAWVILPSYVLSFPVLSPMGLSRYANLSNVFGMCIQLILLLMLFAVEKLNVYTLCLITSITEVSVFFFRFFVVLKNQKLMKTPE